MERLPGPYGNIERGVLNMKSEIASSPVNLANLFVSFLGNYFLILFRVLDAHISTLSHIGVQVNDDSGKPISLKLHDTSIT